MCIITPSGFGGFFEVVRGGGRLQRPQPPQDIPRAMETRMNQGRKSSRRPAREEGLSEPAICGLLMAAVTSQTISPSSAPRFPSS
jgi:hypothetical protein